MGCVCGFYKSRITEMYRNNKQQSLSSQQHVPQQLTNTIQNTEPVFYPPNHSTNPIA